MKLVKEVVKPYQAETKMNLHLSSDQRALIICLQSTVISSNNNINWRIPDHICHGTKKYDPVVTTSEPNNKYII